MDIKAGDLLEVECPAGQLARVRAGDKLPTSEKPFVKVLSVDKSKITLGPLRSGEFSISLPCDSSTLNITARVTPLSPELQAKRFQPLEPTSFDYPDSLYWILVLVTALILGTILGFVFRKKKTTSTKKVVKIALTPKEILNRSLSYMQSSVKVPEAHHMHELYKGMRNFVEKELKLTTQSLTTDEFLGTFRALALQQSANQNFVAQLEYLLRTADALRFAGQKISENEWIEYLKKTKSLMNMINPQAETSKK